MIDGTGSTGTGPLTPWEEGSSQSSSSSSSQTSGSNITPKIQQVFGQATGNNTEKEEKELKGISNIANKTITTTYQKKQSPMIRDSGIKTDSGKTLISFDDWCAMKSKRADCTLSCSNGKTLKIASALIEDIPFFKDLFDSECEKKGPIDLSNLSVDAVKLLLSRVISSSTYEFECPDLNLELLAECCLLADDLFPGDESIIKGVMTPLLRDYFLKTTSLTDIFKKFTDYYTIIGQNQADPSKDNLFTKLVKNLNLDKEMFVNCSDFFMIENIPTFFRLLNPELLKSYMSSKESLLKALNGMNNKTKSALLLSNYIHLFSKYDGSNMSKNQEDVLKELYNSNEPKALLLVAYFKGNSSDSKGMNKALHRAKELGYEREVLAYQSGGREEEVMPYLARGSTLAGKEQILDEINSHPGLRALKTYADQGDLMAQQHLGALYLHSRFVGRNDPYFRAEGVKLRLNTSKRGVLFAQEGLTEWLYNNIKSLETCPPYAKEAIHFLLPLVAEGTIFERSAKSLAVAFRKKFSPKS